MTLSAAGLIALLESIKDKTTESERSINQLNAVLIATGGAAGVSAAGLDRLNASLQKSTVFSGEDIRAAETALLRFRQVQTDVFTDAIKLVPDLATALGTDLPAAAQLLGKALTDPGQGVKQLRLAGIELNEQQKDLAARFIETGQKAQGQRIFLDELAKSIGGASEADNKGLYGSTKRLTRAFGDLEIAAGHKLFGDNHTVVESFTGLLDRLVDRINKTNLSLSELFTKPGALASAAIAEGQALLNGYHEPVQGPRQGKGMLGLYSVDKSPLAQDPEDIKAAAAAAKQADDEAANQRYLDQQLAIKKLAEGASNYYALDAALQKRNIDLKQANLEFGYSRGEITTEDYFAELSRLSAQQVKDEQRKQDQIIAANQAQFNAPSSNRDDREAASQRIRSAALASNLALYKGEQTSLEITQKRLLAIERLADAYDDLASKIADAQGDSATGAALAFDRQNREFGRQLQSLVSKGNPAESAQASAALQQLAVLRQRVTAQAQLNDLQGRFGTIMDAVDTAQSRIDLAVQTGNATEIDGINAKTALSQKYIDSLTKVAKAYEAIARASGDPKALQAADALRLKIEQLAASSDVLNKKFRDVFESSFTDALTDLATGAKSLKDVMLDLVKSLDQGISHIAAQNVAESLFGKGGQLGGIPDFFAGILGGKNTSTGGADSGVSSLGAAAITAATPVVSLGTAAGVAASALLQMASSASAGGLGSLFGGGGGDDLSALGGIFGGLFADGGDPPVGKVSIVGERGPELFVPKQSGTIIPNSVLNSKRNAKSVNNITVHVNVTGAMSTQSATQAGREAGLAIHRALNRS